MPVGATLERVPPRSLEPDDLQDFIETLQERFRTSATADLAAIQTFQAKAGEPPKILRGCFNHHARNLEQEDPPSMSKKQLETHYLRHLETPLSPRDFQGLDMQVRAAKRERENRGRIALTTQGIHAMALELDREEVIRHADLRAARLAPFIPRQPARDRMGRGIQDRLGEGEAPPLAFEGLEE